MQSKLVNKIKQNKAFTLIEMLVAVAVLVILLGISVIAVNNWSKSLKITELDNYAKSIYLEAQNQLAALETEGKLASFYNSLITPGNEYESHRLTEEPSGYVGAGDEWKNMYYFAYNDGVTSLFISDLSMANDTDTGLYLLELNPENGDVYGVFYWEADNEFISGTSSAEIYQKIKENLPIDRSKKEREDKLIGYYGATTVTPTVTVADYKLNQKVEIINDEELYVKISYDYRGRMLAYKNPGTTLDITVTVTGKTSNNTWTQKIDIKENDFVNTETQRLETGLLLDGFRTGQEFKSITSKNENGESIREADRLLPGEDIEVTVETKFVQGSIDIIETSGTTTANSLYQSVNRNGNNLAISVSKVRHLRNLSTGYYALGEVAGNLTIKQSDNIDFAKGLYAFDLASKYVGTNPTAPEMVAGPVTAITPIVNDFLFNNENGNSRAVLVDGDGYKIKNLVVFDSIQEDVTEGEDEEQDNNDIIELEGAGLFAQARNVQFKNISLVDYTLKAENRNNVGALVGNIIGGSIENCGVYLEPYYKDAAGVKHYYNQEIDAENGNVMSRHYAQMYVSGGNRVGALIGNARNTQIEKCYGAVRVEGNRSIGGLVGNVKGGSISDSYASGDINTLTEASKVIGGFIGRSNGTSITNAYASGDVYGDRMLGGFVGKATQTQFSSCNAYGKVLNMDGLGDFAKNKKAGGFVGQISGGGNEIELVNNLIAANCHYLSQMDYNTCTSFTDAASTSGNKSTVGLATTYAKLVTASQKAKDSYPYDGLLLYKAFPFTPVLSHHYGDWASQYLIRASLVYYERYEDQSYGFYSVTDLTDISREEGTGDDKNYVWVLDSLKDETCVEDGYALLSMYYLDNVQYEIDQVASTGNWTKKTDGTLKISNYYTEDGSPVLLRLRQQGFLEFKAYNKPASGAYSKDYTGETVRDAYTTSGMYLYQLPYDLQCTDRYNVQNFYDRLIIKKAYAVGNTKEGSEVIKDEAFFYCPHFAKTAVNPGIETIGNQKLENPKHVAIRSARQLNALGRTPYYWNPKGGLTTKMSFEQEVDINFSTYGSFNRNGIKEKTYCGKEFNLLAFDQEYSNRPIGEWSEEDKYATNNTGFGSFQNDYNGNYHKIIDYCVKGTNAYFENNGMPERSNFQYVGLFGEIYKAKIQNVVMLVSDKGEGKSGNYMENIPVSDQNNAGLIIGSFEDITNQSNNAKRLRTGVGALVGSDYTIGKTDGKAEEFTIYNCAVSGYQVEYHINKPKNGGKQPLGIAVGGLIGYSRGNTAHCMVTNDVRVVMNDSITGDTAAVMIGGFVGSCYYGTTLNCYSGGSIDITNEDGNYLNRLRVAGFCPGWLDAPGITYTGCKEEIRYQNIYTYTSVSENVWAIKESKNGDTFNHFIPVVGRMELVYEERLVWDVWRFVYVEKWHTDCSADDILVRVPGFAYYLSNTYTDKMVEDSEAKEYFQNQSKDKLKTCDPAKYTQLSNFDWVNSNKDFKNYLGVRQEVKFDPTDSYSILQDAKHVYPYNTKELAGVPYPFPAFVKDAEGKYVHYGDWPLN